MEQELISKKDLLAEKGISYGQLYRWKRKNLIPEDWFIRKSTFTGQETFFPKDLIFARIDKITNMKENLSLDDLAEVFSPVAADVEFTPQSLVESNIISEMAFSFFMDVRHFSGEFEFEDILQVYLVDLLLTGGDISQDEAKMMVELLDGKKDTIAKKPCELYFVRKFGVSSCLLVTGQESLYLEKGTKVVKKVNFSEIAEQLKSKMMTGGKDQ